MTMPDPTQMRLLANDRARLKARRFALLYVRARMRSIVNVVRAWDTCGRPACKRARACRTTNVACFDEWNDTILDRLNELVDWSRFEGPFDGEQLDAIAEEMRQLGAPM